MQKLKSSLNESLNERLQAKYPHLELAVLPLSQVNKDNESKRIDSEYFKKEYLENEKLLLNLDSVKLENFIAKMTGGATPLGATYLDSGVSFLRVQNIMQNYFNLNDIVYISHADDENLKRSRLKLGDMLLTITGAYGKAAVVEQNLIGANINQHSVKIETKDINPYFLATFINSKYGQLQCDKKITGVTRPALDYQVIRNFLIPQFSQDFQLEIEKLVKDSHKALEDSKTLYKEAENLLYESLGLDSVNPLESLMRDTLATSCHTEALAEVSKNDSVDLVDSKDTHAKAPSAEGGGTKELHSAREGEKESCHDLKSPLPQHDGHLGEGSTCGDNVYCHLKRSEVSHHKDRDSSVASLPQNDKDMNDLWLGKKYPHLNISIRALSQSYGKSGRLDSEYYQSKYDAIERKIKDYKGGYCRLQDLILSYSGGFAFSSDDYLESGDLALIRINNIKNANLDMSNAVYLKNNAKDLSPKDKVKQGDILISMSGSIGLSCLVREDIEAMTNQRILKVSIKDFSGDVLVLLLNSIFCKLQFERIGTGGVQTNISSSDILNVLIPKINSTTQEQIASKIQKSFALRKKAKDLLESAKSKVECAIDSK